MLLLYMAEDLWAHTFLLHGGAAGDGAAGGGAAGDGLAHSEGRENDCLYPVQMQRSQSLFDEL